MSDGKRIDQIAVFAVGVPVDLGWAIAVLHADHTVSRRCKGCGVEVRTPIAPSGRVDEAAIIHRAGCPVVERLGNNPLTS